MQVYDEDEEDATIELRVCEISGEEYEAGFKTSMFRGVDGVVIVADKNNAA